MEVEQKNYKDKLEPQITTSFVKTSVFVSLRRDKSLQQADFTQINIGFEGLKKDSD